MKTKANKEIAAQLRDIAKEYETQGSALVRYEFEPGYLERYSCNAVYMRAGGKLTEQAYDDVFELTMNNDKVLWAMYEDERRDMRVMMLSLAAAMAETGDLIVEGA